MHDTQALIARMEASHLVETQKLRAMRLLIGAVVLLSLMLLIHACAVLVMSSALRIGVSDMERR